MACIWSESRFPRVDHARGAVDVNDESPKSRSAPERSVFQQDYDRLLFSTPVRRLADKTQVWPMDENDGVRTRLTHSHEVANLARSIGARIYESMPQSFMGSEKDRVCLYSRIQPILLSIGLGHDLGNPPFGHQGEAAIGKWFERRANWIFTRVSEAGVELDRPVPSQQHSEFTDFDGNPQALRLLTRLQSHIDGVGLDLTAATLAAGLKYPVSFTNRDEGRPALKKGGYFESEKSVVDWIRKETGLAEGERHPLTWIMEACDDIAYSVLDVDDLLKKGIISPDEVVAILARSSKLRDLVDRLREKFVEIERKVNSHQIQQDIKIQYIRAFSMEILVAHASDAYVRGYNAVFETKDIAPLMDDSELCNELKGIAKLYALNHPVVLKAEAEGASAISGLMSELWFAITNRKKHDDFFSKRENPRAKYIFSLISPNYVQVAVKSVPELGVRYAELRLLTDMISGMTDSFAMRLWESLGRIPDADRA